MSKLLIGYLSLKGLGPNRCVIDVNYVTLYLGGLLTERAYSKWNGGGVFVLVGKSLTSKIQSLLHAITGSVLCFLLKSSINSFVFVVFSDGLYTEHHSDSSPQ